MQAQHWKVWRSELDLPQFWPPTFEEGSIYLRFKQVLVDFQFFSLEVLAKDPSLGNIQYNMAEDQLMR